MGAHEPSKQELIDEIARLIGVTAPSVSTGSTEPREIFDLTVDALGLDGNSFERRTKQAQAKRIVEAAGHQWKPEHESRGGTVTRAGLAAVADAVRYFRRAT